MNDIEFINPARTCSFTGHRIINKDFNTEKLKEIILKLIDIGYNTFLVGMAIGFDTVAFKVLEEIRLNNDIKIIACIPCVKQSLKFNMKQKTEYDRMLCSADEKIYVGKNYTSNCMQKRNEFMVNKSSCVISYLKRDYGGTANTVKYAVKKGVKVIEI